MALIYFRYTIIFCSIICFPLPSYTQVFIDVAQEKGIDHAYGLGTAGGGVSFCDFNNDGWDDLTLATEEGQNVRFFQNNNGFFVELPSLIHNFNDTKQILWVDFDNDGDKDLFIANYRDINRLYRNDGSLNLQDVTEEAGLPTELTNTFGASWADFNRDGWLDLYYANKNLTTASQNFLFQNNGDGTFANVSINSGTSDEMKAPFCMAFFDYNNDNWPDIYIAHDKRRGNTLLENNSDLTFRDVSEVSRSDLKIFAMCTTIGDVNNDGWLDIYVTNTHQGNSLLINQGKYETDHSPFFIDVADDVGVGFYGFGWGSNFLDGDNDGDLDLYVSGSQPISEGVSSLYYTNNDGVFHQMDTGFVGDTVRSYNNAIGDFNRDGRVDIIVQNVVSNTQLWSTDDGDNHWMKIKLRGVVSNRDAIGARINIYAGGTHQTRYIHCGIGFLGQNSLTEIVGLGTSNSIDSIVTLWPSGHIDRLYNKEARQVIFLTEGSTTDGSIHIDRELDILSSNSIIDGDQPECSHVYPNPTTGLLRIDQDIGDRSEYQILNVNGEIVDNGILTHLNGVIDISSFPNGLYILLNRESDGTFCAHPLVKIQ